MTWVLRDLSQIHVVLKNMRSKTAHRRFGAIPVTNLESHARCSRPGSRHTPSRCAPPNSTTSPGPHTASQQFIAGFTIRGRFPVARVSAECEAQPARNSPSSQSGPAAPDVWPRCNMRDSEYPAVSHAEDRQQAGVDPRPNARHHPKARFNLEFASRNASRPTPPKPHQTRPRRPRPPRTRSAGSGSVKTSPSTPAAASPRATPRQPSPRASP